MKEPKQTTFDYERAFGWRHTRHKDIATSCFLETDNGTKQLLRGLTDPDEPCKETYHETYSCCDFLANKEPDGSYSYVELAYNIYPLLLRLFPVVNGSSPIGGRHDTQSTQFQKLSRQEQNEQAPIIARGAIAWFIAWLRETTDQVEDYESDMDDFEVNFMRDYYMDMQERNIDWLHTGRRWRGIDLLTPFEDEHLKTETEYYEQAKISLPKYLGEHHPRLVDYALEFGKDYLEFVKEAIAKRRKYTAEHTTAHRQGDSPTEGKQAAPPIASNNVSTVVEAETDRKLKEAVEMARYGFGNDCKKAESFLKDTKGMKEMTAGKDYYQREKIESKVRGNPIKVYEAFCLYNNIEFRNDEERRRRYKNTFQRGIREKSAMYK